MASKAKVLLSLWLFDYNQEIINDMLSKYESDKLDNTNKFLKVKMKKIAIQVRTLK